MSCDYMRLKKFCEATGWEEAEVDYMIKSEEWVENYQYFRTVDKYLFISIEGYEDWVNHQRTVSVSKK